MEDHVGPTGPSSDLRQVAPIGEVEGDMQTGSALAPPVDAYHLIATPGKVSGKFGSDESGRAGNESLHAS